MYTQTTHGVTVTVTPSFLDTESTPDKNLFVWAYKVRIENNGSEILQLRTRYWKITDAYGRVQEVRGAGVIGEEPIIAPGEYFEYTSGTPLQTPSGIMTGSYAMQNNRGELVDIDVPAFSLDFPGAPRQVN